MILGSLALLSLGVMGYLAWDLYREWQAQSRRVPVPIKKKSPPPSRSRRIWE